MITQPNSEIWAILEHRAGVLAESNSELVAELADIAQRQTQQTSVSAVLLISPEIASPDMTTLSQSGITHLYLIEHPSLAHYTTEGYLHAIAWLMQQQTPLLIATSATANGRDWTPRLASRLHLPFVPACLSLELRDDRLLALRSVYNGRAYIHTQTIVHHHQTALATLVPGVRGAPASIHKDSNAPDTVATTLTITRFTPQIEPESDHSRIQRLAIQAPSPEAVELEAAERIVAGGRGVGQEGFATLASFARLLGAAVGATRVATDRGWVEHTRQIGATGKSVHPKLYIACGISGAAQHTIGIHEAQTIVAINPDRSAPIFSLADLGLLGDANQILPLASKILVRAW